MGSHEVVHAVILSYYSISLSLLKEHKPIRSRRWEVEREGRKQKGKLQQQQSKALASIYSIGKLATELPHLDLGYKI